MGFFKRRRLRNANRHVENPAETEKWERGKHGFYERGGVIITGGRPPAGNLPSPPKVSKVPPSPPGYGSGGKLSPNPSVSYRRSDPSPPPYRTREQQKILYDRYIATETGITREAGMIVKEIQKVELTADTVIQITFRDGVSRQQAHELALKVKESFPRNKIITNNSQVQFEYIVPASETTADVGRAVTANYDRGYTAGFSDGLLGISSPGQNWRAGAWDAGWIKGNKVGLAEREARQRVKRRHP